MIEFRKGSVGDRLKFLLGDSALYGGGAAVAKAFTVLLVPVLTRLLTPADYGVVDVLAVTGAIVVFLATVGQDSAVARFFYETDDEDERRRIVTQALAIQVVLSLLLAVGLLALSGVMARRFLGDEALVGAVRIIAVGVPFTVLLQFARNLLKWTFRRVEFLIVSVGWALCVFLLTLWWVAVRGAGVYGVLYAQLAATIFVSLLGLAFCARHLVGRPGGVHFGALLRFGWPYMVVGLLGALVPAVDRSYVTGVMGLDAMGEYAVGYKLAFLLLIPVSAFQTAWSPMALAIYRERDAVETYDRVLLLFVVAVSLVAGVLGVLAHRVVAVFATPEFLAGSVVVLPLAFALVLEGGSWIAGIGVDLSKRTYFSVISYVLGLAVALLGIALLIGPFGLAGVAYGVLLGKASQAVSYAVFGHLAYPMRFSVGGPVLVVGASFAVGVTHQWLGNGGVLHEVLAVIALLLIAVVSLRVTGNWRAPVSASRTLSLGS